MLKYLYLFLFFYCWALYVLILIVYMIYAHLYCYSMMYGMSYLCHIICFGYFNWTEYSKFEFAWPCASFNFHSAVGARLLLNSYNVFMQNLYLTFISWRLQVMWLYTRNNADWRFCIIVSRYSMHKAKVKGVHFLIIWGGDGFLK